MAPPTGVLSSLLLLVTVAGCACKQCSEGRTYSNAVISPNLETTRIMRVSHTFPVVDCTAACCDLSSCDLAWWFEGHCYLVSCPRKENCEPKKMGSIRSYLTFVLRPVQRPAQLLDYGDMMLNRGSSSGIWGDSPEDIRKDLPFLGKDWGLGEMSEYSDDYRELEKDLLQPSGKQEPRGSAEYTDWGLLPGSEGGFNSSAGDSPEVPAETQQDPELHYLNESASTAAPKLPERSVLLPWPTTPSSGELLGKEKASQLQEQSSNSSGKEVLMPSHSLPPASLELSSATVEKSPVLTVTLGSTEHSIPTPPTSTAPSESTPSELPISPTTAPRTVKELMVSAGDNLIITLPDNEVELKAFVVPAPPAETTYNYEWSLINHPIDYQGEIKQGHMQTLHLSQLSVGLYVFKVTVSSENAFGEGFVNVTVKPARRANLPPVAVVSPQLQELTWPLTSALIDGSQSTDDTEIVSYHWEEINGPFIEEKTSVDSPILRLSNLDPGNYSFRLTVRDSDGATNSTTAALRVNNAVDYPPVANAGPNHTITLPQNSITLNGNQSSDDHQIVLYEWSLGPGSEGKHVAMEGMQTPYLHLSAMQEGDYTFQLKVTDSSQQQSTAVVTVIVQPENNRPPVAVAGPDKELIFPVESATLDGSSSSDDHGIVFYHWEHVRGPSAVEMEDIDKAIATVTGLQVGTYRFRLTVKDQQGLSSTSTLTVAVKKENHSPPRARAGGRHVLVLPNNSITLDGSRSTDDQGIVSYLWIRDGQSPAAGDVIDGSDHSAALQLTNLVEGVYTFHLRVTDSQGASDMDTATVDVQPDPRKSGLVELTLQVGVGQLTEQRKDTLVRQLAVLLNVLDSDIKVQKIRAHSDLSTVIVFYVQSGPPFKVLKAAEVARNLHTRLSKEKADFLLFKVLRVDTAGCLLKCSGHGHCDPLTKRCICSQLWMENLIQRYIWDGESNCEWSIFYVTVLGFTLTVLTGGFTWLCICCCKRQKRTKIRKKTKYTILDNMDEQERMELRPKYGIKHRSTEHNSSLMVSESEFDSDQDTIFSREKMERGNPKVSMNGSIRNGASFSYCSKDR
ncbi:dyslexia-associated protein KIAA0319 homolog isoform X1 [Trachypithecus francoisi]|uniref:dyslexia-associated protein KIAA0319 homolog isoform X1 n=3 Tax=Trachypithecus francoisi TaxID=54180 RepID=UPI00141B632B|nr:dyslexia-associated protein KIAA0319 homolog isoform X1 [Trachypithecus francoisi]XP_033072273.1 dyslexia-associated protein KIAA0319 homolog isoform X1 [Trachypithecus francoisi]XP_033072274.1 dyslexia-associated protein KIAA0319 homolog isoform X1 [Trachypithecus francoisi]XP_033072275.1 dyslexia-associated protein KIAA0319 homolog isoform X1 [Trachypithecus francoisi]XP_033072276.1 dyslexia-associated protein KIAA0319 homolog isoform X1 [Trachypithecus francoisi]XP_033072277.1 dyslexia-a